MKTTASLLMILALLASCEKKPTETRAPPTVLTVTAEAKDTPIQKIYVGHVQAYVQVEIKSQVEGVFTGYYFTEGQEVKEGDLMITIDSRPYEAQLEKAQGALAESIANLRLSEDTVRRYSKLASEDYVAQLQYDEYLTNVAINKAEIAQNKAEIETAKINISYCNIHAPITGVTGRLQIQQGNLIQNAGDTPLVLLNQITPTYVYFSVPQKDLPEIMRAHRENPLKLQAVLSGDSSHPFDGILDLIDNQIDESTGSLWLRGVFANEEKMLWPGEFTDVTLILSIKKDAVLVPAEAVVLGQKGHYAYVIKEDHTAEFRAVKLGERYGDFYIINEGIKAGEQIATEGQINLTPGEKVSIKKS
jgi:multidrug efflux system membrane fusion protein